ncbi:MAG: hypothetical protein E7655_04895 [Ruminococcaceae bacterium]|nr:hypothetical protein [Oscillospiraceae bacterium]
MRTTRTYTFRSPIARRMLLIGLPTALLYLLYILFSLEHGLRAQIIGLRADILSMLEHVLLSLTLLVGGACLFDIADREKQSQ